MNDTAVEIELKLSQMGVPLVLDALAAIESNKITPLIQNESLVCGAPRLKKEEGRIDWNKSAQEIINLYRALQPWPKTFTDWVRSEFLAEDGSLLENAPAPLRLILGPFTHEIFVGENNQNLSAIRPGTILKVEKNKILVQTGRGVLRILEIQPSGKNKMTADAFIRGYRIKANDRLI